VFPFFAIVAGPLSVAFLFLLGVTVGGQVNLAIYRFAWNRRWISPWSTPPPHVARRSWLDTVPIMGWFRLRRESNHHGRGFWIRPLLIELSLGFAAIWFYGASQSGLLYPTWLSISDPTIVGYQTFGHMALIASLVACTFIDFDEKTIPDELTVSGTLLALLYLSLVPQSLLPDVTFQNPPNYTPLWLTMHRPLWPALEAGQLSALALALFVWFAWTFALLQKTCTIRNGIVKGVAYLFVSIYRHRSWIWMLPVFFLGGLIISIAWWRGGEYWLATLTSLAGIAVGGGMIWMVRVLGSLALQQEAMGFGDVTLMAMIGALLGWQATVIIFFLAPIAALFIAVGHYVTAGKHELAFGPYLALATVAVVSGWAQVWFVYTRHYFALGWLLPSITIVSLFAMGVLLWLWRTVRDRICPFEEGETG
jgi:prepilin signal peptidase PulO-like enzyme (type II secretory pathway)